ncbi:hypothetical protein RRG08_022630 [Elysia crispata]|uniref:Uncharacterized protein n=1 Tax=Elysia crispata TaxID=231223 RepID=A0AAE0Z257_9GAST|nr:hypothetical protein RRG08_022630 [Elysia crispata]
MPEGAAGGTRGGSEASPEGGMQAGLEDGNIQSITVGKMRLGCHTGRTEIRWESTDGNLLDGSPNCSLKLGGCESQDAETESWRQHIVHHGTEVCPLEEKINFPL